MRPNCPTAMEGRRSPHLSVAHYGPYPPAYGGVPIHIRRLHHRLLEHGVDSHVYCRTGGSDPNEPGVTAVRTFSGPTRYMSWMVYPSLASATTMHCHDAWGIMAPMLCRLLMCGKRVVVTVHDQRDAERWAALGRFRRTMARALLRNRAVQWIAVSDAVRDQLLGRGVAADRIAVIPAFLPPPPPDGNALALPANVKRFIMDHSPVLSAYGFRYWIEDGIDIYGFDLCIDAVRALVDEYPRTGLVICVPEVHLPDYHAELIRRVEEYGITQNVLFLTTPLPEAYPLWQASDVYLRPTSTDGDSLAIREALSLGVPVVASDASVRPEACVLFPSRDGRLFSEAVRWALRHKEEIARNTAGTAFRDTFPDILEIYESQIPG